MKRKRQWLLTKQLENMETYITQPGREAVQRDKPRKDILKQLDRPSKHLRERTAPLMISLGILASWEATVGAVSVLKGDPKGWERIRLGFVLGAWSIRCRHAMVDREQGNETLMYNPLFYGQEPHFLAEAIATGDDAVAHGFGRKLFANFTASGGGDPLYFYTIPFHPFMFKLYGMWTGREVTFRKEIANPIGRYQQVIDSWHDAANFGNVLGDICDYHCQQCFDLPGEQADFVWLPYNVFPVEILAIKRIRRDLGLPTPEITHPLLESALVNLPAAMPAVSDELLERIKARAHQDFPEVGDPW